MCMREGLQLGFTTDPKVLDNPFGGKAVTAYCAGLAVCFFHKVTLIQPEVYLGNVLLNIYHIKIICEYLWKDTTQQLLGLHDAKITNTYEIMCMRREGVQLGFTTDPKQIESPQTVRLRIYWSRLFHNSQMRMQRHVSHRFDALHAIPLSSCRMRGKIHRHALAHRLPR